ncbi:MAG: endonuclease/exonuclease/phosphatase family protein [Chloroflexi bacterium]|nr:endonuclease/exonuclease/phosphatase family protein [Chloroflexota bacterium]
MLQACSWNIHVGLDMPGILRTIAAYQPFRELDLLLLQEAAEDGARDNAAAIAEALGPEFDFQQRSVDRFYGHRRGLAAIWRRSVVTIEHGELLPLPRVHESTLPRWRRYPLRAAGLRARAALRLEGHCELGRLRCYNIHLSPMGFAFQMEQMAVVLRDAHHREAVDTLLLAGDFNSLRMDQRRWRRWFDGMAAQGFVEAARDVAWTYWSRSLPLRQKLDHALLKSESPLLCAAECPTLAGSDHYPLFFSVGATL